MTETPVPEQSVWRPTLTPWEFAETQAKVDKINARAAKRGFTGRFELKYERVVKTKTNDIGFTTETVYYVTELTGTAPCYNGWRFLARVDVLPKNAGFTLATAPGVDKVDRGVVKLNTCEHCDTSRYRKSIYLVESVETGEIKNVGSTCIKDFLGWDTSFKFESVGDISGGLDGDWGNGMPREETFTVSTILAAAWLATRAFGWVKSDQPNSTRGNLTSIIDPPQRNKNESRHEREYREKVEALGPLVGEAKTRVPAMTDWVQALDDSSTFNENLKAAIGGDEVTRKQIGLLAYVPTALDRATARQVEREQLAEQPSEFIGTVGERVEVAGKIRAINSFEGDYGVTTLYTILTERGLVKWFASSPALGKDIDVDVRLAGTVKKHETFREVKSTVLTRCRELAS